MEIIAYARVSSREQAENSHALEQQIARLKAAGCDRVFCDVESGTKDDRHQLNALLQLVEDGQCVEVVVTRLDRLTRSLPHLRKVLDVFQKAGATLRALDDAIDTSTAAGKFHLNMMGALAEMEVDRLSERIKHGWAHLRDRKVAVNSPFGYHKVGDRHELDRRPFLCLIDGRREMSRAVISRDIVDAFFSAGTIRLAMRLINERYGIQMFANNNQGKRLGGRVAQDMFRFSPGGLVGWLTNPVIEGHLCYLRKKDGKMLDRSQWQITYNTHEALITAEEAARITEILSHNKRVRGYGSTALKYPLSGLIFCGECRGSCYSMTGAKSYQRSKRLGIPQELNHYFQCKNWRTRACHQKKVVRMEVAEEAVISALMDRSRQISDLADSPLEQVEPQSLRELRAQLASLQQLGFNAAIETAKAELQNQIDAAVFRLQQKVEGSQSSRSLLLGTFGDQLYWSTLPEDESREIFRALVDRVVVRSGQVESVSLKV